MNQSSREGTVNIGFLRGPTGVGGAKMAENAKYSVTFESDVSVIADKMTSGELSFAAVPTNTAAVLWNKTGGAVKVAALTVTGVMQILENGDCVHSVADLKSKTIFSVDKGANTEFVLRYILQKNGLVPDKDVFIDFLDPAELTSRMISGDIGLAMLPVPLSTAVMLKNRNVRRALTVSREWEKCSGGVPLMQGCIVMAADAEKYADSFLADYEASARFMSDPVNIGEASSICARLGIIGDAETAKSAIPECGLTFVSGVEMKYIMSTYLETLFNADPASVGGTLPGDGFYRGGGIA